MEKYNHLASLGTRRADSATCIDGTKEDKVDGRREGELQDMDHRTKQSCTKRYLSELKYCLDGYRQPIETLTAVINTGDSRGNEQNGVRGGSPDPSLPSQLAQMEDTVGAIGS